MEFHANKRRLALRYMHSLQSVFEPFSCIVSCERNRAVIQVKVQIMAENTENNKQFGEFLISSARERSSTKFDEFSDVKTPVVASSIVGDEASPCKFCGFKPNALSSTNYAKLLVKHLFSYTFDFNT